MAVIEIDRARAEERESRREGQKDTVGQSLCAVLQVVQVESGEAMAMARRLAKVRVRGQGRG